MKAEHRHELETNKLAHELEVWGEKIRPHGNTILTVVAVLLGLYALLTFWNSRTAGREQEAWLAYEKALLQSDPDYRAVQAVAASDDFAGTTMQEWATMAWADRQLRMASEMYLVNRDGAKERLTTISAIYEQYAADAVNDEIRNRARLGLARTSEMLGRLDDARRQYAEVQGPLSTLAAARIKELEGKHAEDTVKWLASAELPRRAAPTGDGLPGVRPGADAEMPASEAGGGAELFDPAQSMEEILGGAIGTGATGTYEEGATTDPAADPAATEDAAPAADDAAPSESSPATDAPATDQSPAADAAETTEADAQPGSEGDAADTATEAEPAAETPAAETPADAPATEETPAQQ
jgi:hypothetical protein